MSRIGKKVIELPAKVKISISGDGAVFNLTFTAKAKGTGAISIAVPGARNSKNQPMDVLGSQSTVTVN